LKETRHSSLLARNIPCCAKHPARIVLWVCANRTLREASVNRPGYMTSWMTTPPKPSLPARQDGPRKVTWNGGPQGGLQTEMTMRANNYYY